jgi:hypothetical protein
MWSHPRESGSEKKMHDLLDYPCQALYHFKQKRMTHVNLVRRSITETVTCSESMQVHAESLLNFKFYQPTSRYSNPFCDLAQQDADAWRRIEYSNLPAAVTYPFIPSHIDASVGGR